MIICSGIGYHTDKKRYVVSPGNTYYLLDYIFGIYLYSVLISLMCQKPKIWYKMTIFLILIYTEPKF